MIFLCCLLCYDIKVSINRASTLEVALASAYLRLSHPWCAPLIVAKQTRWLRIASVADVSRGEEAPWPPPQAMSSMNASAGAVSATCFAALRNLPAENVP